MNSTKGLLNEIAQETATTVALNVMKNPGILIIINLLRNPM